MYLQSKQEASHTTDIDVINMLFVMCLESQTLKDRVGLHKLFDSKSIIRMLR